MTQVRDIAVWALGGGLAGGVIAAGVDLLYFNVVKSNDVLLGLGLGAFLSASWTLVDVLEKSRR